MAGKSTISLKLKSLIVISTVMVSSCAKKSDVAEADGDVLVKIGIQTSATDYNLKVVQLKGIEKLNEVSGSFARFFYSPGSNGTQLTGTSPRAQFIHTQNFFVPSDYISMQMAAIYFHLQNLALFDKSIGADGVNKWPRSVGLETQISDASNNLQKNNAFYNGQTDSMMFVPYTDSHLPISVNAGIIAHEHFHSLFYKLVIRSAFEAGRISTTLASIHSEETNSVEPINSNEAQPLTLTDDEKLQIYNETILRGMNEGFADFWGWVYTDDPEFMRWSLPEYQADRTLNLLESRIGQYESKEKINNRIEEAYQYSENPKSVLINYSYQVGTPYARFLKQLSSLQATAKSIELADSKKLVAQVIFNYMKDLGAKIKTFKDDDSIEPLSLVEYVAKLGQEKNLIQLDQASCNFIVKYMNQHQSDSKKQSQCKEAGKVQTDKQNNKQSQKGPKDTSFVIVKNDK